MVNGSSAMARRYGISDLVVGLTIVAFGTSAPELVVNLFAASANHSDIVLGNLIGSNNFNLFVILGVVGLISPFVVQSNTVWKEVPLSLLAALLLLLLSGSLIDGTPGTISRWDGLVLLLLFSAFLYYIYRQLKTGGSEKEETTPTSLSRYKMWGMIIAGLAGLVLGGKLVVDHAVKIAGLIGVSEKVIGLTIVAAGTSLPELVTSVVAALKKNSDIAIGNVVGSNIFNLLLVLSLSSFVRPISFDPKFNTDLLLLAGGTLFLFLAMFTGQRKKLDRWEAAILLLVFMAYTVYLVMA